MKALSVRQPRAEQILQGSKMMDVRTWQVAHRGPLAIHASSTRRLGRTRELGFDPEALPYSALVGVAELVDILPLDVAAFEAYRAEHLSEDPYPGVPCYGWRFANPQWLPEPIPWRGAIGIFNVPDELFEAASQLSASADRQAPTLPEGQAPRVHQDLDARAIDTAAQAEARSQVTAKPSLPYHTEHVPEPDPARPFLLFSLPEPGGGYRVALYQWLHRSEQVEVNGRGSNSPENRRAPGALWGIELRGNLLRAVADHLINALRANEYRPSALAQTPREPLYLDEPSGLRLALIFLAVKPLTRYDRIEAIGHSIQAMSDEEAYYWFSKCSAGPGASRAQRALRVLLSDE